MFSFFNTCCDFKTSTSNNEIHFSNPEESLSSFNDNGIIMNDEYQEINKEQKNEILFYFLKKRTKETEFNTLKSLFINTISSKKTISSGLLPSIKDSLVQEHTKCRTRESFSPSKAKVSSIKSYLLDNVY
jgi:hypothetical protein